MESCPFCNHDQIILASSGFGYAIYDKFPVSKGHTLVIPKRHVSDYFNLQQKEKSDLWALVEKVKEKLLIEHKPDGFNVGFNVRSAAGQTVFHAHVHIIPRYEGDVEDPTGGIRNVISGKGPY